MYKRPIALIISVLAVLGIMVTGTWAYYQDSESSPINQVSAATMDLVPTVSGTYSGSESKYTIIPGGDQENGKAVFSAVARGQSGTVKWVVENIGNLGGTLTVSSTVTLSEGVSNDEIEIFFDGSSGRPINDDGGNGDLDQYLMVTLQRGIGTDSNPSMSYILGSAGSPVLVPNLETALDDAIGQSMEAAGGNDNIVYLLSWELPGTDPDVSVAQGDSAEIDITFNLDQ